MGVIWLIAKDEWRYWARTKLALVVIIIGLVLTVASVVVNSIQMSHAKHERDHLQQSADKQFLEQPDRHPHRMVHYGHYVFRTPSPLSIVDPGVDAYTGTAIFLEGHQQNSAMFADQRQSSGLTRFSSLSPAFLLQILMPLLIIMVGYGAITREKEQGTIAILITQGVGEYKLLIGKFLALLTLGSMLLLPLLFASIYAIFVGESALLSGIFVLSYLLYVAIWSALVVWVSSITAKGQSSFAISIGLWIAFSILIPRVASSTAATMMPSAGKLESDFAVLDELRKLGDGHIAIDPAFAQLQANLLTQYNAESIDELPINFRGAVAEYSENQLTEVLNQFAETRMHEELSQAKIARLFGWLSPTLSIRSASMALAGTHLETHHRFLREAEALRFEFVQSLNRVHREKLSYEADINRYKDKSTAQNARVDSSNWQVLSAFEFKSQKPQQRLVQSFLYFLQLLFCLGFAFCLIGLTARRLLK